MRLTRRRILMSLLVPLAVAAVLLTAWTGHEAGITDWMAEVGTYVSGFAYMVMVLGFFYLIDLCEVPDVDFVEQIADDPKALAILLGLLAIAFALVGRPAFGQKPGGQRLAMDSTRAAVADTLCLYRGRTEVPTNSNRGAMPERFLAAVGLGPGYPYCAAAASYAADAAGLRGPIADTGPFVGDPIRSALSAHFLTARQVVRAQTVASGHAQIPRGSIAIWLRGNTRSGHTAVVLGDEDGGSVWRGRCGRTIEANTTPSDDAPGARQREGGGVYVKTRCFHPHAHFRLIGFAVSQ
jgi:hypothetical protein